MAPTSALNWLARRGSVFYAGSEDIVLAEFLMTGIATLLVINRVYFRLRIVRTPGWDDWAIIASLLSCYAMHIITLVGVHHGYGKPLASLSHYDGIMALKSLWLLQLAYKFCINFSKISLLLLYRRIFVTRKFGIAVAIVGAFVVLYAIPSIVANVLECSPVAYVYDKSIPGGKCINLTVYWYANAVSTTGTDIIILLLPMPVIRSLRLPSRQKYGLMVIFALGALTCIASFMRLATLKRSSLAFDQSRGTYVSCIWTVAEATLSVICPCLPMLRTPLAMLFPNLFPSFSLSGSGGSGSGDSSGTALGGGVGHGGRKVGEGDGEGERGGSCAETLRGGSKEGRGDGDGDGDRVTVKREVTVEVKSVEEKGGLP
ncbi:hypothetical protein FQN55_000830 [Onygenales sp. PD_40]|nr:hypothetical protein FQN55_000830 [Onygenales sp. PD_40]